MNEVKLPWPPAGLSPNDRLHWAKKALAAKRYKHTCWALALEEKVSAKWDGPVHLWVTFAPPDRRHRDMDNMIASIKSGLDGLAMALKVNDSRFVLHLNVSTLRDGCVLVNILPEQV